MTSRSFALFAAALIAAGCAKNFDGQIPCADDTQCPTGFYCDPTGKCLTGATPAPTISSVAPASGAGLHQAVTITGTFFSGTTAVSFNGTAQPAFTVVSPLSITTTVPAGATTGPITVTTPAGTATSSPFTILPGPSITGFLPAAGAAVGAAVTLEGANFTGSTSVAFNGTAQPAFTVNTEGTQIATTVPAGATTGPIVVSSPLGVATSASFTIWPVPTITSVLPDGSAQFPGVPVGTQVTITGTNFLGATAVAFSGTAQPTFTVSQDGLSVATTVPSGAASGPVTVTTPGGTASSSAFVVTGSATKLAFLQQASTAQSGVVITPAVTVAIEDASGDLVSSATDFVTLSLVGSGGVLSNNTVAAVGGIATFNALTLTAPAGNYILSASSGAYTAATSTLLSITSGQASQLAFTVQPPITFAAGTILPTVKVAVEDSAGNVVTTATDTITLSLPSNANAVLTGNMQSVVNGYATFTNLDIKALIGPAQLLATSEAGSASASSNGFFITVGAASQLVFTRQPSSVIAGQPIVPAVNVAAEDSSGNLVTTYAGTVTLGLSTGLAGTLLNNVQPASGGIATFTSLALDALDGSYTLVATDTDSSLASIASSPFSISTGQASKLVFTSEPAGSIGSGAPLAVAVSFEDDGGNVVPSSGSVTLSVAPVGCSLVNGTVVASSGVASFTTLAISATAGTTCTLTAASNGVASGTSSSFNIGVGPASQLVFKTGPSSVASGAAFAPSVVVQVEDTGGNVVTSSTASVALTLATGTGTLSGATVNAAAGIATFTSLSISALAASGYSLRATSGALQATSGTFGVTVGQATKLGFTVQPTSVGSGANFAAPVAVSVEDSGGNIVTSSTATIALTLATGTGTLTNASIATSAGVATFTALTVSGAAAVNGYSFLASTVGGATLSGANSSSFSITVGQPTQLVFTVQPPLSLTNGAVPAIVPQVSVEDSGGNVVTSATGVITLGITPSGSVTNPTQTLANGVAIFGGMSVAALAASAYQLTASGAGLPTAQSSVFGISPGAAAQLVFSTQPSSTIASGAKFGSSLVVNAADSGGNFVVASGSVTLATTPATSLANATATLDGTGTATFSSLTVSGVSQSNGGGPYTFAASVSGGSSLSPATSNAFNITVGAATQLAFTSQPSSVGSGSAFTPLVAVGIEDSGGNVVTTSPATSITLALATGSGTISNGTATTATAGSSAGIAIFSTLSVAGSAANNFSFNASAGGFSARASNVFSVGLGQATKLVFTVQPTAVKSGAVINGGSDGGSGAVAVSFEDSGGNIISSTATVTLTIHSGTGTLTNASAAAVGGVATFPLLTASALNGTSLTLDASGGGLTDATPSSAFTVSTGAATHLVFSAQPVGPVASGASFASPVVVAEVDSGGNTVNSSGDSIAMSFGTGSGSLTNATATTSSGVATFTGMTVSALAGTSYALKATATSGPLTGASYAITSGTFSVTVGNATTLVFTTNPSNVLSGATMTPAVVVKVEDSGGNVVTSASTSITLAQTSGSATLTGQTVTAVSGVATFSAFTVSATTGSTFALSASGGGLSSPTASGTFTVSTGAATKLVFTTQPSSVASGATMTPAVVAKIEDSGGNVVTTNSTASVVLSLATGTGTLTNATVTAASGVATFTNLTVSGAIGSGYSFTATSSGLSSATSGTFPVTLGAATQLVFSTQPTNTTSGVAMSPAVVVKVEDSGGNTVTTSSLSISLAQSPATGSEFGQTATASAGVATFSSFGMSAVAGSTYTLTASGGGFTSPVSSSFSVSTGPATQLVFTSEPPASVQSSAGFSTVVSVEDSGGNTVTGNSAAVALAFQANPAGGVLGGTLSVAASHGVATFTGLTIDKSSTGYSLHATSSGLAAATSSTIAVTSLCASGTSNEAFDTKMEGCANAVTYANRAPLCASSAHVCSADEWVENLDGGAPKHNYWTDDDLRYSTGASCGTGGCLSKSCFASLGGGTDTLECGAGATPMRVCGAASDAVDAGTNVCNWTSCGYNSLSEPAYIGGCAGNTTAGALCCAGSSVLWVDSAKGSDSNTGATQGTAFKTITHALSVAQSGQVIRVDPGAYNAANGETFPLVIPTNVVLRGDELNKGVGTTTTTISGGGITVGAGATLAGFQITGTNATTTMSAANSVVRNNTITATSSIAILANGATNSLIALNAISGSAVGIYSYQNASGVRAENNTLLSNSYGVYYSTPGVDLGTLTADGGVVAGASVGNNTLSCNTTGDVFVESGGTVHMDNDSWDHDPPWTATSYSAGIDILNDSSATISDLDPELTANACPSACSTTASATQSYDTVMQGCGGAVAITNSASLCNTAAGCHVCTSADYINHYGGTAPARDYWTSDLLATYGTNAVCSAYPTSSGSTVCGTGIGFMICAGTAGVADSNGNVCAVTDNCGYNTTGSNSPNAYFGGCPGTNTSNSQLGKTSGAVCCCD